MYECFESPEVCVQLNLSPSCYSGGAFQKVDLVKILTLVIMKWGKAWIFHTRKWDNSNPRQRELNPKFQKEWTESVGRLDQHSYHGNPVCEPNLLACRFSKIVIVSLSPLSLRYGMSFPHQPSRWWNIITEHIFKCMHVSPGDDVKTAVGYSIIPQGLSNRMLPLFVTRHYLSK